VHANQANYSSILNGLITQQSLENKQYLKSITEANKILSNHKFDIARSTNKNKINNLNELAKHKQKQEKINLSFAQMERKYFCCSKPGHKSLQCQF
jgi:hypothetical protein